MRYWLAVFLSAFLLFQIQPLMAKHILPWFGGGATIWTTCMLFFQTLLLVGYVLVHALTTYLPRRGHAWTHAVLLCTAVPPRRSRRWPSSTTPSY